jgi:alkanesulfonate monooxygenase SsuD/methylene tetrahydromethanopterin reductase-like flavin-dependent oxidoreductase (luciferase family)
VLPVWIAVGGTPQSAARAGSLGLPMALAIIGGEPARFAPFAEIHRAAAQEAGHGDVPMSINSHGYIAEDSRRAVDEAFPPFAAQMNRIGRERGWGPMTREAFEQSRTLHGANFVGNPEEVVEKILFQHRIFGHQRFMLQFSVGSLPHDRMLRSIELFGTRVAPVVRQELGVTQSA